MADFFRITPVKSRNDYLLLKPEQINIALKYESTNKFVWLFPYGCICLANFEVAETYRFFKFLETTSGPMDYHLISTYNETHSLEFQVQEMKKKEFQVAGLYATILAKSTELKSLEDKVNSIIDQSELFIIDLQKGFSSSSAFLLKITAKIIKIQINIINNLHLLDRPIEYGLLLKNRNLYHQLNEYYELEKRFTIIQKKIADLNEITAPYQQLGHINKEKRLIVMEVILLVLFPLFHLINRFF